mgnify:CR=1 FL=1
MKMLKGPTGLVLVGVIFICTFAGLASSELQPDVRQQLKGKEAVIFDNRLLTEDPMTLQEIGDRFGISRERVRQIESRLKKKLKAYLEEEIEDLDLLQESMIEV